MAIAEFATKDTNDRKVTKKFTPVVVNLLPTLSPLVFHNTPTRIANSICKPNTTDIIVINAICNPLYGAPGTRTETKV